MEDTLLEEENKVLIEEMLANAKEAPEPGSEESKIIHSGDTDQPAPIVLHSLVSAGWVYIYETKTGEMSLANRNNLPMLLKVKNKDGTRRFTTKKPPYSPKVGTMKCLLHAENPEREHYDEMGLPTCRKSNLRNRHAVTLHMEKRHPMEWKAIEQERKDNEKKEEREFMRSLMQGRPAENNQPSTACLICGKACKSYAGLKAHMRKHKE